MMMMMMCQLHGLGHYATARGIMSLIHEIMNHVRHHSTFEAIKQRS